METQLTDFGSINQNVELYLTPSLENAAFSVFVVLLNRVVLAFDLSLYIPLSKVDENMQRAQMRDAVNTQKFFFRRFIAPPEDESQMTEGCNCFSARKTRLSDPIDKSSWLPPHDAYEEMTIDEIFNGKSCYFPGLIPLVYVYLEHIECDKDPEVFLRLDEYLQFISARAKGQLITCATWQRNFVTRHPSYKQDSIITEEIAYDLMMAAKQIGEGMLQCPELLGKNVIPK